MRRVRPPMPSPTPAPFDEHAPVRPFIIGKIARQKGLAVLSISKGKGGRRLISFTDRDGSPVEHPAGRWGFGLYEAKRYLEQLPDRSR